MFPDRTKRIIEKETQCCQVESKAKHIYAMKIFSDTINLGVSAKDEQPDKNHT